MGESSKMLLLGLLLAIAGTSEASTIIDGGPCPENWIDASFAGMGCLFFNTTEVTTWEEASVSCYLSNNSTLVEIWTELQLDFLRRPGKRGPLVLGVKSRTSSRFCVVPWSACP